MFTTMAMAKFNTENRKGSNLVVVKQMTVQVSNLSLSLGRI